METLNKGFGVEDLKKPPETAEMALDLRRSSPLLLLLLLFVFVMTQLLQACQAAGGGGGGGLHPVVIVPGNGGNQLEARLTADYRPSSLFCRRWWRRRRGGGWFRLWFDPSVLVGPFTRCFAERMTLRYAAELDDNRNAAGVETRVPRFGSTLGLLYLDPTLKHVTEYMETLVRSLEAIGYEDGSTLFGAPYDFRYGLAVEGHPSKVGTDYLRDLRNLVEHATAANGSKPAVILAHSLGCLFALHLLLHSTPAWRRQHVAHLVALSPPWGGSMIEMLTFASGSTLGAPLVDPLLVRDEQRSSESNMWLLPAPRTFGNDTLVVTPRRSYTAADMAEFLEDIGYGEGVQRYQKRTLPLVERLPAPGVAVTCVVGMGVRTPEKLVYRDGDFDRRPEVVYGDGDGTVNLASLVAVEAEWAQLAEQPLKVVRLPGVSHTGVLKEDVAVKEIVREINSINSRVLCSTT